MIDATKPYRANNIIIKKSDTDKKDEIGFLNVSVINNTTLLPVKDAKVALYEVNITGEYSETAEAKLIGIFNSDENGKIPIVELPINRVGLYGVEYAHNHYHMTVDAPGYYLVTVLNIQIYENLETIYQINLSPVTSEEPLYKFIITPIK